MAVRLVSMMLITVVRASSHWLDAYEQRGYFVLPRVFSGARLMHLRAAVARYLRDHGNDHKYMMRGEKLGGWFVPGIERIDQLKIFEAEVARDERLARILRRILGDDFKLLERSEIYVSRIGNWHSDDLYDAFDLYATSLPYVAAEWCPPTGPKRPPPLAKPNTRAAPPKDDDELCAQGMAYGFGKATTFWAGEGTAHARRVTTVAVYLEDHGDDTGGLSVAPGSHKNASVHGATVARLDPWSPAHRPEAETPFDLIRSGAGDAVVFDSRLVHRGPRDDVADFRRELSRSRRTVATFSFGRNNAVSEAVWKSTSASGAPDNSSLPKSFLGDGAAALARSSGEGPASPRYRAGVASMAWRTTRRFSTNAR